MQFSKKYGITPEQYHGGDLVGNHCIKLMQNSDNICAELSDLQSRRKI